MRSSLLFWMISLLGITACREMTDNALPCLEITPGMPFEAKIHDTWCLPDGSLQLTFGPILEDGRCNIQEINCFWEGQMLLETEITNHGEMQKDTFRVIGQGSDTLVSGQWSIIMQHVSPEERPDFSIDTSAYRFTMLVTQ